VADQRGLATAHAGIRIIGVLNVTPPAAARPAWRGSDVTAWHLPAYPQPVLLPQLGQV
jgi:hypothetical protein